MDWACPLPSTEDKDGMDNTIYQYIFPKSM